MADERGLDIQHIALQKLLYFSHAEHLVRFGGPLIRGEFEAWKYGPVHPVTYNAFKAAGLAPLRGRRATVKNLVTRTEAIAPSPDDSTSVEAVGHVLRVLGGVSAARLVQLSHAKNGPWAAIVDKARTEGSLGLRIPDKLIVERFFQVVRLSAEPPFGDVSEDAPLAA